MWTDEAVKAAQDAYRGHTAEHGVEGSAEAIRAALEAADAAMWQPIETAPMDGRCVILCGGSALYDSDWTQTPNPVDGPMDAYWSSDRGAWVIGTDEGQGNFIVVDFPTH